MTLYIILSNMSFVFGWVSLLSKNNNKYVFFYSITHGSNLFFVDLRISWTLLKYAYIRLKFNLTALELDFWADNIYKYSVGDISALLTWKFRLAFDFPDSGLLLTRKLMHQGSLMVKMKSSLWKFYGRHYDSANRYEISVSQMTMDMFYNWSYSQSFPRSWLTTRFITRVTRWVLHVEQ